MSEAGMLRDRPSGTLEPGEGDQGWHLNSPGKPSGGGIHQESHGSHEGCTPQYPGHV